jgi:hypothetical protein
MAEGMGISERLIKKPELLPVRWTHGYGSGHEQCHTATMMEPACANNLRHPNRLCALSLVILVDPTEPSILPKHTGRVQQQYNSEKRRHLSY